MDMALFGRAKEAFFREFLCLRHGVPSHDTFSRVFRLLDPVKFHACFLVFMRKFSETIQGVIAIDGKTLRRSFDRASQKSALHLVGAWAADQRLVLGQLAVDGKSNEITAVPKLLDLLSLKGAIVTADGTQLPARNRRPDCRSRRRLRAGAQGLSASPHGDVSLFFDGKAFIPQSVHAATDGDHGRIETRISAVSTDIAWLQERHRWPGPAAIGKVTRIREPAGKT